MDNSPQQSQDSVQKGSCDASLFNMSSTILCFNRKVCSNCLSLNLGIGSNQSQKNESSCMGLIMFYLHLFLCWRGHMITAPLMVLMNVPNAVLIDHHINHLLDYIRWKRGSESCIKLCNTHSTNANVCQCIIESR